eukprot:GHVO01045256.1.p2 GENE.GHVO01045256.1~~GHVO01045256.1.p2  ORF type:complete len:263 (+),score=36.12 GHVO01045256.1:93-881(+)
MKLIKLIIEDSLKRKLDLLPEGTSLLLDETTIPEVRAFLGFQISLETVHNEALCALLGLVAGEEERNEADFDLPQFSKRTAFVDKWCTKTRTFPERLVAIAALNSIFSTGSYTVMQIMARDSGLDLSVVGTTFDRIMRDAGLDSDFCCYMFSLLTTKPSKEVVTEIIRDAVDAELAFIDSWDTDNQAVKDNCRSQVEFIGDSLMNSLIADEVIYGNHKPLQWLNLNFLKGVKMVSEIDAHKHKQATVTATTTQQIFDTEVDF